MSDTNLKSEHLWTILEATEEYDGAPVGEERMCPTWVAKAILEDVKTLLAANEALKAQAQGEWVPVKSYKRQVHFRLKDAPYSRWQNEEISGRIITLSEIDGPELSMLLPENHAVCRLVDAQDAPRVEAMPYSHRNGERELPTEPGLYWFQGLYSEDNVGVGNLDGSVLQITFTNGVGWVNHGSGGWYLMQFNLGSFWGPVTPPWDQSAPAAPKGHRGE